MAKTRLTGFSKLIITLLILAGLFFGGRYLLNNTSLGQDIKEKADEVKTEASTESSDTETEQVDYSRNSGDDDVLRVQLFTWGGYAPGLYFNEGWEASTKSRFYTDYGLKVEFVLIDDFNASRQAWAADKIDIFAATADAIPTEMAGLGKHDPQIIMQVDWSRGGDALVVQRGINSINDLAGKKVAVTPSTPSQTFLIKLLDAAGMEIDDITMVETPDNFAAAAAFKSREVDAAVVWAPDDEVSVRDVAGAKILQSTETASHIIADVLLAKKSFIDNNRDKIHKFYKGWMQGAAELNTDRNAYNKAAGIFAKGTLYSEEDAKFAMSKAYFTNHGDNMNFFKKNNNYRGVTGEDLYNEMGRRFSELGFAPKKLPRWQSVAYGGAVTDGNFSLKGAKHAPERSKSFMPATSKEENAKAVATKPLSISFATGSYNLTDSDKNLIDLKMAGLLKSFANARVRVEGNTDDVGGRAMNQELSKKRAQSVANYLMSTYNLNPNKFIIKGNGPDNPVAGCEGSTTAECRAKNRRTEFQLIN